ncbi:type 1 fimbrial protein [Buttiauxella sp. B2]|uniref:fimbrial protein n=1 Tax=Buttiauxella sp. B2 TaxID=2587812 RepID=UPI0011224603|nr:fimbrial protein [Buttiauxella sp. B2]TNV20453.1 type 1 fimbrial protein [Buttiauxella sp. B2]
MNKVSTLALLTCITAIPSAMAAGDSMLDKWFGTVAFDGFVYDSSCQISNADKNKTISLPAVRYSDVQEGVERNIAIPFTITLHGCNAIANRAPVIALDRNSSNATKDGYLKNTGNGPENIALLLMDNNRKAIDLRTTTYHEAATSIEQSDGNARSYKFHVGYIKLNNEYKASTTVGPVLAQAYYRITYL